MPFSATHSALARKLAALCAGLLFAFLFLEAGLRLFAWTQCRAQARHNLQAALQKGSYRILCLGESTTMGQYPPFLERDLNSRVGAMRFTVIDRGAVNAKTGDILNKLEADLDLYKPDMVVSMMGINDDYPVLEDPSATWYLRLASLRLLRSLSTLQLIPQRPSAGLSGGALSALFAPSCAWAQDAETDCEMTPVPDFPCLEKHESGGEEELASIYRRYLGGSGVTAESACLGLSRVQAASGNADGALATLDSCLSRLPTRTLYLQAGRLLMQNGRYKPALARLEKALGAKTLLKLDGQLPLIYVAMAQAYDGLNDGAKRREYLEKTVACAPEDPNWRYLLADCYYETGMRKEAALQFERLARDTPRGHPRYFAIISALAALEGDAGPASDARALEKRYNAVTARNYRKLRDTLFRRGIRLVAVQYPMRALEQLQLQLEFDPRVLYVDNRALFRTAVARDGYDAYFHDRFAGDFGHCTPRGNKLLAEHIADAILQSLRHGNVAPERE